MPELFEGGSLIDLFSRHALNNLVFALSLRGGLGDPVGDSAPQTPSKITTDARNSMIHACLASSFHVLTLLGSYSR